MVIVVIITTLWELPFVYIKKALCFGVETENIYFHSVSENEVVLTSCCEFC